MGIRVIEQLKLDWLAHSIGRTCEQPIIVGALPQVVDHLVCQRTRYGSMLEYYESMNLAHIHKIRTLDTGKIHIDFVPVDISEIVTVFIISDENRKVIYAPCDVKPFPESILFTEADVLIIGDTIIGEILKDGFVLGENNDLRNELFVMEEVIALKEKYQIKKVVITHLEEDWGKSFDDYLVLPKQYEGIEFAYDGMLI
jgi:phosphoribosyl 1,2-cyclic phosphate phosphodiesterase